MFEIQVPAGLIPSGDSEENLFHAPLLVSAVYQQFLAFLGLWMHHSSLPSSLHGVLSCIYLCLLSSSYKDSSHIGSGLT